MFVFVCLCSLFRFRALTWPAGTSRMRVTVQVSSPLGSGWVWWLVFSWFWSSHMACTWSWSSAPWTALTTPRVLPFLYPRLSNTYPGCLLLSPLFSSYCSDFHRPHTHTHTHFTSFTCVVWCCVIRIYLFLHSSINVNSEYDKVFLLFSYFSLNLICHLKKCDQGMDKMPKLSGSNVSM